VIFIAWRLGDLIFFFLFLLNRRGLVEWTVLNSKDG
jgi:hypothetical protein